MSSGFHFRSRTLVACLGLLCTVAGQTSALAQPGTLDDTFGQGGFLEVDLSTVDVLKVLPESESGLTLIGLLGTDAVAIRVQPDGTGLDPAFGVEGVARIDFGQGFDFAGAGALASDGRVVLAGASSDPIGIPRTAVVARMNADGTPDLTFATDGVFRLGGYFDSRIGAVRSFEDGSIVAIGSGVTFPTATQESEDGVITVRLTAEGQLDQSFGDGGVVFSPVNRDFNGLTGTIGPDGTAIVAGTVVTFADGVPDPDAAIVRVLPSGDLDETFGEAGLTVLETPLPSSSVADVGLDSAGRIVGAGLAINGATGSRTVLVFRLRPDGNPDPTFGDEGIVTERGGAALANGNGLAVQADRSIVVVGNLATATRQDLAVFKFTEAGELDEAFGTAGVARLAIEANGAARSGIVLSDGAVVAVGTRFSSSFSATGFVVARVQNDGAPVGTEATRGIPGGVRLDLAGPNPSASGLQIRLTNDVSRDLRVVVHDVAGRTILTLHDGTVAAGETLFQADEDQLAPGVYIVRAVGSGVVATRRVVRL